MSGTTQIFVGLEGGFKNGKYCHISGCLMGEPFSSLMGVEFIVFPNSKIYLIDNSKASKDVPLMLMRSKREGRGHRTMVHSMEGAPC